jgi:hypothetical protein
MENVIKQELEHQQSELISSTNQGSWLTLIGFQRSSIEEKYRQQCVKELERILIARQQLDRTTKNNYAVRENFNLEKKKKDSK